jgi:peptide/nickel transport system permease protein
MWTYIIRRILFAIPIALGVSMLCFALIYLAPGNPLQLLLPPDATAEAVEMIKKAYGFDKPIPLQYLAWVQRAAMGDLGISLASNRPVRDEVLGALSNTMILSLSAVLIAFSLAFVLGAIAAYFRGRPIDRIVTALSVVGVSVPNYWLGMVLIIFFSVELGILPATGMGEQGSTDFSLLKWESFKHAILPVTTLCMIPLGIIMRTTRSAVAEVLGLDFIQTLRAKGLSEFAVVKHALSNALPQVLAVMGLQFGYLMGGSILVETIFTWPGTGFLLHKAILTRDLPVLQGTILVLALFFVAINLVVDLMQTWVDPRIKRA